MRPHVTCSGTVDVPLPAQEAFGLFTPEGERLWVAGWAPEYPAGNRPAPSVGVVFVVGKEEGASFWVVTGFDRVARRASYAYTLPGRRVCVVDVAVDDAGPAASRARVTYHMTSVHPEGDAFVRAFPEGYDAMLRGWEQDIRTHLVEGVPVDPTTPERG